MVQVLDFPGVASQGRTLNSARRMIKDAMREMVAWYMEDGKPLPLPQRGVKDKQAVLMETIRVTARIEAGAKS